MIVFFLQFIFTAYPSPLKESTVTPKRRRVCPEPSHPESDSEDATDAGASKTSLKGKNSSKGKSKTPGKKTTASKSKPKVATNGECQEDNDSEDSQIIGYAERRIIPKTNYDETSSHCPLPGCDSKGVYF